MKITKMKFALVAALLVPAPMFMAVAGPATPAEAAAKNTATKFSGTLKQGIKSLKVANEDTSAYNRSDYRHWIDANGNGLDTRQEVLKQESTTKARVSGGKVVSGRWVSYYDKKVFTNPSKLDIDHMVPLKEAHESGAHRWNAATRQAFANDLADKRSLVAVNLSENRSKSDRDPSSYLPPANKCRYVSEWVAVKIRWSLAVDKAEKKAINKTIKRCKNGKSKLKVKKASIGKGSSTPPSNNGNGAAKGLKVIAIAYDPAGTDTLNGEYVVFKNTRKKAIKLQGWTIQDAAGTKYTFPKMKLKKKGKVTLYSGSGKKKAKKVYWNRSVAVWNNSGDSFKLSNPRGKVKQTGSYRGAGDGSIARF